MKRRYRGLGWTAGCGVFIGLAIATSQWLFLISAAACAMGTLISQVRTREEDDEHDQGR